MDEPARPWCVIVVEGDDYLVCVRRENAPTWLQIIATFTDEERAEGYAEVQNMWFEDPGMEVDRDIQAPVPTIAPPPDKLPALRIRASETRTRETTRREIEVEEITSNHSGRAESEQIEAVEEINPQEEEQEEPVGEAGKIPDLILRFLPGWMEKFPLGPTIRQIVDQTKLHEPDVRAAIQLLRNDSVTAYQHSEDRALHILPLGYTIPEQRELSTNQVAILGYLATLELDEEGTVSPPSSAQMSEATSVPQGSIGNVVGELERKGKIKVVQRGKGGNMQKPRYRVVERQILRQALAEREGPKDRSHLVFDDPAPNRRAT